MGAPAAFLLRNSYSLATPAPWLVVFVAGGQLAGRADPFFDSSQEVSPVLLEEWRRHHPGARAAAHLPLGGDELLRAMARLGFGSLSLAQGLGAYLRELSRAADLREFYLPGIVLSAVAVELRARPRGRPQEREVRGAWLAATPQSPWSQKHVAAERGERGSDQGYLWYAPVYPASSEAWRRSVTVQGPASPEPAPREHASLQDWLAALRGEGLRVVPVLGGTDVTPELVATQEAQEPRGVVLAGHEPPAGWWRLLPADEGELRLVAP